MFHLHFLFFTFGHFIRKEEYCQYNAITISRFLKKHVGEQITPQMIEKVTKEKYSDVNATFLIEAN